MTVGGTGVGGTSGLLLGLDGFNAPASASPIHALQQQALTAINGPIQTLTGRPLVGNGTPAAAGSGADGCSVTAEPAAPAWPAGTAGLVGPPGSGAPAAPAVPVAPRREAWAAPAVRAGPADFWRVLAGLVVPAGSHQRPVPEPEG